jgi:hypothetical protein
VFAGDPLELDGLIDFWNLRASGNEVLFVPIRHYSGFEPFVRELFKAPDPSFQRPARKICFSRSSTEEARRTFADWFASLFAEPGAQPARSCVSADYWKAESTRINKYIYREESETLAPIVEGRFQYQTVFPEWLRPRQPTLEEKYLYVAPAFRGLYHDHDYLVDFPRDPGIEDGIRKWWGANGRITDEGLALLRSPLHRQVHIRLPTGEEAIEAIFLARNMRIKLSEPGHVAKQIIKRLGGIDRCRIFKVKAVRETLDLLNDSKARPLQEILKTIGQSLPQGVADLYVEPEKPIGRYQAGEVLALMHKLGMVQQGWRLQCGTCSMYEWYAVSDVGNDFECRWCFTKHATPQLVRNPAVSFEYRANGLYLAHQKMKGSVPVITSLWRFVNSGGHFDENVFTTNIEVEDNAGQGKPLGELDFVVLMPRPAGLDEYKLVLGEARGANDYGECDVRTIREVADRFGKDFVAKHVCLCFSTLKDAFLESEKQVLRGLVKEGYEVIPLTRLDLDPYDLHERFKGLPNQYFQTLEQFAANTRQLNLQ